MLNHTSPGTPLVPPPAAVHRAPPQEAERLAALHRLDVLDSAPEQQFDDIVALACGALGVPMAAVSLVDAERQWFKARRGIGVVETPRSTSFCSHAITAEGPLVVRDAAADERFAAMALVRGEPGIRSYAGVPLRTEEGHQIGALCALDTAPRDYSEADLATLGRLARIVMTELELRRIAQRDQLTGALTRRAFLARATDEIERHRRYGPTSLALLDIDHFKTVNDTHGHPAGDAVLGEVARAIAAALRPSDALGRLGGEEFGVLLPETTPDEALRACERVRQEIEALRVALPQGGHLGVTISIGIADVAQMPDAERWLAAADAPLYAAKRGGRNRCVRA